MLDEEVNEGKRQVSHMLENEVLPTVEQAVKMDVLQIMKYKNEHKICKLKRIFKQNDSLARCLERGLTNSELLLLLLVCERQKLTDMADLYEQCHQEITEEYTDFTSRMVRVPLFLISKSILREKRFVLIWKLLIGTYESSQNHYILISKLSYSSYNISDR